MRPRAKPLSAPDLGDNRGAMRKLTAIDDGIERVIAPGTSSVAQNMQQVKVGLNYKLGAGSYSLTNAMKLDQPKFWLTWATVLGGAGSNPKSQVR